jgi:predicted ribosome quality control (RQC) complex YloA/Tae2 family protein
MCGVRQLAAGLPYDPPPVPTEKVSFLAAPPSLFYEILHQPGTLLEALMASTHGLSRLAASQMLAALGWMATQPCVSVTQPEQWVQSLVGAQNSIRQGHFAPQREPQGYNVWGLQTAGAPLGISRLLDTYYHDWETRATLRTRRERLRLSAQERIAKQSTRLKQWENMRREGAEAETWKVRGDLLAAHLHEVTPAAPCLQVTNYFDPEQREITLTLDPQLSPSENVQRFYRRYRKAKNALAAAQDLLKNGQIELQYLQSIASAIELADEVSDLEEISLELDPASAKPVRRGSVRSAPQALRLRRGGDVSLLVGKNNQQNDHVTFKEAHASDWWLHTRDHPGAHVIIRADQPVGEALLHEAALLAAWFSPARHSAQVPVVYARKKHVKKVPGGRPGMVIYEHAKTLFVTPDQAVVEQLLQAGNAQPYP